MTNRHVTLIAAATLALAAVTPLAAQTTGQRTGGAPGTNPTKPGTATPAPAPGYPADFVIGIGDVVYVYTHGEPNMTGDFVVRPDGKISMPMLPQEIRAMGMTPTQLRDAVIAGAREGGVYDTPPNVNVTVKAINSRRVTITGSVHRPGPYQIIEPMNIVDLVQLAGGFTEYAKKKEVLVFHAEKRPDGSIWTEVINFDDIYKRKNLAKNVIMMRPGDSVIVK
jgi:polysaccharide export outer membrane protein